MNLLIGLFDWFQDWSSPWYWVSISIPLFILGAIGTSPIYLPRNDSDKATLLNILTIKIRHFSFLALFVLIMVLPFAVWGSGISIYGNNDKVFTKLFFEFLWEGYKNVWEVPILGMLLGWSMSFCYHRYIVVTLSKMKRKMTMKQTGEELSDIRAEDGIIKTKNFNPEKHYKKSSMFYGINKDNKPIYISDENWKSTHQRYVGPTQTGKGVEIGVQLDQAIRKGFNVFFIDPKPDKHAKAIMRKACEESGRAFIELNLNAEGKGKYAPFLGGTSRDRRARLMYALGLFDTGESADFYKSGERTIIDNLMETWDGHLDSLKQLLKNPDYISVVQRSLNYINEWLSISTFKVDKRRTGFSIERSLIENAVVYVQGNLDDEVLNKATTVLLMEIVQECKRLYQQRNSHTFVAVDEVAFLINEKVADALATVASFDCNILLAYQSEGDLLNLKDKTLNSKAIASRVKTNCKISLYYMAMDIETAQIMADESGLIQKSVTRSQKVDIGRHLQETWEQARDIHKVEEALFTSNKAKMLPPRVGILYQPAKIAQICYTDWIKIDLEKYSDKKEIESIVTHQKKEVEKDIKHIESNENNTIDLSDGLDLKIEDNKEKKRIVIDDF